MFARRPVVLALLAGSAMLLMTLALFRPLDHDENQYVGAVALAGIGLHPYRDFAYLQTPLQPYLLGPPGAMFGTQLWLGLRLLNALFGWTAAVLMWRIMCEEGVQARLALGMTALFLGCDPVLFSLGVARNDALPLLLLVAALLSITRAERGVGNATGALLTGLFLAAAVATKLSYACPALAYGVYALTQRRHRPAWVLAGAAPVIAFVWWAGMQAPDAFRFEVLRFGVDAPAQWYARVAPFKMSFAGRALDLFKFLALGVALPAVALLASRERSFGAVEALLIGGVVAAFLPAPTWRQYVVPMLPPLFLLFAKAWSARPPHRWFQAGTALFAMAGLVPTIAALREGLTQIPMLEAYHAGAALGTALDRARANGPVATLSPALLPAARRLPDVRFVTGPFYFRSHGLLDADSERRFGLVSQANLDAALTLRPAAGLVGGETAMSGDPSLDRTMEDWARRHGYHPLPVAMPGYRLYVGPDEIGPRLHP